MERTGAVFLNASSSNYEDGLCTEPVAGGQILEQTGGAVIQGMK